MISPVRIASLLLMTMLAPLSTNAAVVINEIAWMGTSVSANAEWIELYNSGSTVVDLTSWRLVASGGSPSITLTGTVSENGYFLLERTSDASVPDMTADQIYTGALNNSGATLTLSDASGTTADEVIGGSNWANVGGDNASKQTAQRASSGWQTAVGTPRAANPGSSSSNSSQSQQQNSSATTTTEANGNPPSGGGAPEYVPIPSLRISADGDRIVSSGADTAFTAIVYDQKGNRRDDAFVTWSFGDGMRRTGASVFHAYFNPGEYVAVARATTPDGGDALAERVVTVQDATLSIVSLSSRGVSLKNESARRLDLSLWRLFVGGKEFRLPENTYVLPGRSVLFSPQVTGLPLSNTAFLLYPNGDVAAAYPPIPAVSQLTPRGTGYEEVQAAGSPAQHDTPAPFISTRTDTPAHEDAVEAPAAATELAAAGAASPPEPPVPPSRISSILGSPWTLGFLAVIVLAGGAFVFL